MSDGASSRGPSGVRGLHVGLVGNRFSAPFRLTRLFLSLPSPSQASLSSLSSVDSLVNTERRRSSGEFTFESSHLFTLNVSLKRESMWALVCVCVCVCFCVCAWLCWCACSRFRGDGDARED